VLLIALGLAAYFGYHTIQGRHGLEARSRLIERASVLDTEIRALEAVRSRIDREIALLSESNPDPDFIDEIARDMLGFAKPGERIIVVRKR
jgi:cell division protein FtsB